MPGTTTVIRHLKQDKSQKRPNRRKNTRVSQKRLPARIIAPQGDGLLPGVDMRTVWAKRFKSTLAALLRDKGGEDQVTEAVRMLARRAAALEAECQLAEAKMAQSGGGDMVQIQRNYAAFTRAQMAALQAIGLGRSAKNITPGEAEVIAPVVRNALIRAALIDGNDAALLALHRSSEKLEDPTGERRTFVVVRREPPVIDVPVERKGSENPTAEDPPCASSSS
jgi:hypothetical protein